MTSHVLNLLSWLLGASFGVSSYIILRMLSRRKGPVAMRLKEVREAGSVSAGSGPERNVEKAALKERLKRRAAGAGAKLSLGSEGRKQMQMKLRRAGVSMTADEYRGFKAAVIVSLSVFFFLRSLGPRGILLGSAIGWVLPDMILRIRIAKRRKSINEQLPETLNIIANGIRAGFSFTQSVSQAVRRQEGAIVEELRRFLRENALGKPIDDALRHLSERVADPDLELAVRALLIQRQVGGSLADILDQITATMRERVKLRGDARTMTAQGKLSAAIVIAMPIVMAVLLTLVNPGYLSLMITHPLGLMVLIAAAGLYAAGIFVLSRIVKVKM